MEKISGKGEIRDTKMEGGRKTDEDGEEMEMDEGNMNVGGVGEEMTGEKEWKDDGGTGVS